MAAKMKELLIKTTLKIYCIRKPSGEYGIWCSHYDGKNGAPPRSYEIIAKSEHKPEFVIHAEEK